MYNTNMFMAIPFQFGHLTDEWDFDYPEVELVILADKKQSPSLFIYFIILFFFKKYRIISVRTIDNKANKTTARIIVSGELVVLWTKKRMTPKNKRK